MLIKDENFIKWYALNLNPEPWRIGPIGWKVVNGRKIPFVAPDPDLKNYQEAVREQLGFQLEHGGILPYGGLVSLHFFFWRQLDSYETDEKKSQRHIADATNMQKALEDALQGTLITNDRNVRRIRSDLIEQTPTTVPAIIIKFSSYQEPSMGELWREADFPAYVTKVLAEFAETPGLAFDNSL
jgi:Holliday junction resolvase RusA-like endonuclease